MDFRKSRPALPREPAEKHKAAIDCASLQPIHRRSNDPAKRKRMQDFSQIESEQMQHIEMLSKPDMLLLLDEETIVDHRTAAHLALKHHCLGESDKAFAWERLALFLRTSEAYIFDDVSGAA